MAGAFGNYDGFIEMLKVKLSQAFSLALEPKWANEIQKVIKRKV